MVSGLDAYVEEIPRSRQTSIPRREAICFVHEELHMDSMMDVREPGSRQIASAVDSDLAGKFESV
jgi:hypothetical protein